MQILTHLHVSAASDVWTYTPPADNIFTPAVVLPKIEIVTPRLVLMAVNQVSDEIIEKEFQVQAVFVLL